ncbi:hypothetical protein Scep_001049 [Stephania cephalantha]|uniref:Uncharacterized protein n=1 Tax=Stephania cephalantha TaxID=152367 RepID=A0AAP0L8M6_9MAGN
MTRDVGPAARYVSLPRHGGRGKYYICCVVCVVYCICVDYYVIYGYADTETSGDALRVACRRGPEAAAWGKCN